MNPDKHMIHASNSVVAGDVSGNIQSVHGDGARAINRVTHRTAGDTPIDDLITALRAEVEKAGPRLQDPVGVSEALEALEEGTADPQRHHLTVRGALGFLAQAAAGITSMAQAVAALHQAFGLG